MRWLVGDRDAVRLQIRNDDGAWACAIVVLRPDWDNARSGGTPSSAVQATAEGSLRGIWYDAGSNIPADNGRDHCSPTLAAAQDLSAAATYGNTDAADADAATGQDPLPVSGSQWNVPAETRATVAIPTRSFERTVPGFDA